MNKKINAVLHNKYFYMVISVIVAVAIWIVALNTSNPVVESTVDVSIIFINENIPAERKLTRTSDLNITTATIKVSGRKNTMNNLLASELKVYVDFADVTESGVTHLKVSEPKCDRVGIKILDYYPKEIDVSYDEKKEIVLDVHTEYKEDILAPGYEFISVTPETVNIPVSGFASDIKDLDHIKVSLSDIEKGSVNSNRTVSKLGRYINTSGHDVTANFNSVNITVKIEVAKRVPVKYSVTGTPAADHYILKHAISSDTVLLQGDPEVVSKINEIDLGKIDVSGKSSAVNKEVDLKDYLPSGVTVYGESQRFITVNIDKYVTKKIELGIDDISISGKNDAEFDYVMHFTDSLGAVNDTVFVEIKGKAADVDSTSASTLKPVLDLTDKGIGSYKNQSISFTVSAGVTIIGEYTINVDIAVKEIPETSEPVGTDSPELPTSTPDGTATANPTEPPSTAEPDAN